MALRFNCPSCNAGIFIRYLKVGEEARCSSCGSQVIVPENAERLDLEKDQYDHVNAPKITVTTERKVEIENVQTPREKFAVPMCYICGRPLPPFTGWIVHYCKQCKRQFPSFMRDGIKHVHTKEIAMQAFHPGGPVSRPDMYCDRNVRMEDLLACLLEFRLIGILGERGVGKSSTLRILLALLRGETRLTERFGHFRLPHRTVLISGVTNIEQLLRYITQELLKDRPPFQMFGATEETEVTIELEAFGVKSKAGLRTADNWRVIRSAIEEWLAKDPIGCFRMTLKLLQIANLKTIILMDEADRFSSSALRELGTLIKDCESFDAVFCCAGILDTLDEICSGHASLSRVCKEFKLERFGLKETQHLFMHANDKLESYVQFTPELVERVATCSDGIPAIIHNIGYEILSETIGNDWSKFAEATRRNGPMHLGIENVELTISKVSSWLTRYWSVANQLKEADPSRIEALRRIAIRKGYILEESEIPLVLSDIDQGLLLLNTFLSGDQPILRTGTKRGRQGVMTRYYTFDDPVFGWLVAVP